MRTDSVKHRVEQLELSRPGGNELLRDTFGFSLQQEPLELNRAARELLRPK